MGKKLVTSESQMKASVKASVRASKIVTRSISRACSTKAIVASANVSAKRDSIPKALRSAVWMKYVGNTFDSKCYVDWCQTSMNPFSFEVGHNIPQSKGGSTTIDNLRPICSQCNKSMGNRYSIIEFSELFKEKPKELTTPIVVASRKKRRMMTCICQ